MTAVKQLWRLTPCFLKAGNPGRFKMDFLVEKLYLLLRCVVTGAGFLLFMAAVLIVTHKWLKKSGHIRLLYFFMLFSGIGAAFIFFTGAVITCLSFIVNLNRWTFYFTGWIYASGTLSSPSVTAAAVVWLTGITASCFLNMRDRKALTHLCRMNQPVTDIQIQDCFYLTAEKAGIKNIPLLFCNAAVSVPFLKGIRCPEVVLPADSLLPREQMLIFAHELTHYKRHDLFFRYLMKAVFMIYWFFPFHSYWMEKFIELQETLCDIDVCFVYGERFSAKMYYTTILSISGGKRNVPGSGCGWSVSGLYEHSSQLERRIRNMVGYRTGTRRKGAALVLSVVGSTLFLITLLGIMFWPDVFVKREQITREINSFQEMSEMVLSKGEKEKTETLEKGSLNTDEVLQWNRLTCYTLEPGQQICSEPFQGVNGETLALMIAAAFSGYEVRLVNRNGLVYASRMDDTASLNLQLQDMEYRLYICNTSEKNLSMELYCTR